MACSLRTYVIKDTIDKVPNGFHAQKPNQGLFMAKPRRGHAPPVPAFLLTQNLSPEDIARSHIMKLKVS